MCFSIPEKVISLDNNEITVESHTGNRQVVRSALQLAIGDFVIAEQGIVTDTMDAESAHEIINIVKEIGGKEL